MQDRNDIEFILLENTAKPNFAKYNEIFKSSKITDNPIIFYKIKIDELERLLTSFIRKHKHLFTKKPKFDIKSLSALSGINKHIRIEDDILLFVNELKMLDILQDLDIIVPENIYLFIKANAINNLEKLIKNACETKIQSTLLFPSNLMDLYDIEELELSVILAINNSKIIGYLLYKINDDGSIYIDYIEINRNYRNASICKKLITHLIQSLESTNNYELYNVGGLAGYSCYVDAFESNGFIAKIINDDNYDDNADVRTGDNGKIKKVLNNLRASRRTKKLNLANHDNIRINKQFNCTIKFFR